MIIKALKLGDLYTNCYILEKNNEVLIIDPASEYEKIMIEIGDKKVVGIIITHYHFDHIGALDQIRDKYNVEVYDYSNLKEKNIVSNFEFKMIPNPGHTSDSITIYFEEEKIMFVGDFVFKNSIGRTDLPTGDTNEMLNSIKKIKQYDDVFIYPGHGEITSLEYEKKNNYYFK